MNAGIGVGDRSDNENTAEAMMKVPADVPAAAVAVSTKRKVSDGMPAPEPAQLSGADTGGDVDADPTHTEPINAGIFVFKYLIVFVAAWESFAHGANDTANATGAFAALYTTYKDGFSDTGCDAAATPVWVMALAGAFVFLGMQVLGARVIRTVGENIAKVNYHTGFCIEFASMVTVVIASFIGLPVSSTHCQVGAVVFVGMAKHGAKNVNWWLFLKICISWACTLPFAGLLAAGLTAALRPTAKT